MIEWVPIEAGSVTLGIRPVDSQRFSDGALSAPLHEVTVGTFAITKLPVTEWDWRAFCAATSASPSKATENGGAPADWDPIVGVSWLEAAAYCEFRGAYLPTEAEWVLAQKAGALREPLDLHEYCADEFAPFPGADRHAFDRVRPPPGGWWGTRTRLDPSGPLRRGVNPAQRLDDTTFRVVKR